MKRGKPPIRWRLICAVVAALLLLIPIFGQSDPNPNSPTPVLISDLDSTRTLTGNRSYKKLGPTPSIAIRLNSKIILYVANIELMKGEGATAFRMYGEDGRGQKYRFPVLYLEAVKGQKDIYAITVLLKNEIGNSQPSMENADLYLRLTWRGLISNAVKLGSEPVGEKLPDSSEEQRRPLPYLAGTPGRAAVSEIAGNAYSADRIRFMEQATFGPTAATDQRIANIGLSAWLNEQFDAAYPHANNPYPDLPPKPSLKDLGCPPYWPEEQKRVCERDFYSMYPVQNWFFKEALYGEAQLRHRVAWALSQIWVISGITTQQASHLVAYHKILSRNAFGNYRVLMEEVTLSPGMGNYLDMARSNAYSPNENYAREILQLFSVGLFMLNQDGTLQLDNNGQPIATYNQDRVNNFTKVFTGWTFCNNGGDPTCPNAVPGTVNFIDPMYLYGESHNSEPKTLLSYPNAVSQHIPAGQNGYDDLGQALDNIFYHPNVAPFISRILIQHLVTSDPTPAYVGRSAAVFNNNGSGVRGDLKAVVRAILLDPEARGDQKTDPHYGKLREPVLLMTNILRQFNVRSADGNSQSDGVLAGEAKKLGQNPFYATTVFNYYSPGYVIPGTTHNAPEFGVMTTSTAITRANFSNRFAFGHIPTTQDIPLGTSIDLTQLREIAQADATGSLLLNELDRRLLHNTMSLQMRNRVLTAVLTIPSFAAELRARTAFFLVSSSSQYQIER